ncbi:MAG TPA: DUF1206 domain-containing protein [Acidimicrobiales bacterium]|jgi:hypothetical protein
MTSAVTSARGQAGRAAGQAARSPWVEGLGRVGLFARGVVWILVGVLAIQIALGDTGERADRDGALQTVAEQPFGKVLLVILAVGFAGYALWRLVEAFVADKWGKRLSNLARAAVYVALLVSTIPFITSDSSNGNGNGNRGQEDQWTAKVLDAPFGRALVIAAGLALIALGLWMGYRGWEKKFVKHLKTGEMSPATRTWTIRLGVAGHLARMVVFGVLGWFLVKAALDHDPDETKGLDGALRTVADAAYGPWLLGLVALGLVAFGLYSLVESRYREVLGS